MAHIMVVDDENNIRMMMRLALQHMGHEVDTAPDGLEALRKFHEGKGIDLVLLDQRMPGMEGMGVLREMRRRNPQAKIIMVTAFGTIDLAVDAIKSGATDFLRKPFTADVLRGAVQAALDEVTPVPISEGVTFGSTTINGYRIEFQADSGQHTVSAYQQTFRIINAEGQAETCTVVLPDYVSELVKAQTDRDQMPGGDRFWTAVCEEALANYLWQNAEFPIGGQLRIEELTTGLRRFVDTVLAV